MKKKIIISITIVLIFASILFVPSIFLVPSKIEFLGTQVGVVTYDKLDERLTSILDEYQFTLKGDSEIVLTSQELGIELKDDYLNTVRAEASAIWLLGKENYTMMNDDLFSVNSDVLKESLLKLQTTGEVSSNAKIIFDGENFKITPEIQGTALDLNALELALIEAVNANKTSLELKDFYSKPAIVTTDLEDSLSELNNLLSKEYKVIFGMETSSIDPSMIVQYININEDGSYQIDETGINKMLVELTYEYDSNISNSELFETKTYYIDDLTSSFISQINDSDDQEVMITAREEKVSRTLTQKANTSLKTYVEVNITSQHLWYYVDGKLVLDSPVVTGNMSEDNWATPPGTFEIMYKQEDQVLNGASYGYDYAVPVEYWMPISPDGVGFHDGDWIPAEEFGTDRYIENGSHGCINLPPDVAKQFYSMVETGTTVFVTP